MERAGPTHRLAPRRWDGHTVSVHLLTWDFCVLAVARPDGATLYVPRSADGLADFMAAVESGGAAGWLRRVCARPPRRTLTRIAGRKRSREVPCVGIEHEFTVLDSHGPVDFKRVIHELAVPGLRADPVDPNAYRCDWGGVVTADGIEAEIATPPVPVGPSAVSESLALAGAGRRFLVDLLGDRFAIEGFSTHVSVTAPMRGDVRRARLYCETFAPALMLLLDRSDSPGLLVRPRPGRLELCGEFADGHRLRVALTFAVASALTVADQPSRVRGLRLDARLAPSRQRFGFFVGPDAFGDDLYRLGRTASLRSARRGAEASAQAHLEACWELCRPTATKLLSAADLDAVEAVIGGPTPLPAPAPAKVLA